MNFIEWAAEQLADKGKFNRYLVEAMGEVFALKKHHIASSKKVLKKLRIARETYGEPSLKENNNYPKELEEEAIDLIGWRLREDFDKVLSKTKSGT